MHSIHYLVLKQVKFLRWSLWSELNRIFCDLFEFIIASTIHMQVVLWEKKESQKLRTGMFPHFGELKQIFVCFLVNAQASHKRGCFHSSDLLLRAARLTRARAWVAHQSALTASWSAPNLTWKTSAPIQQRRKGVKCVPLQTRTKPLFSVNEYLSICTDRLSSVQCLCCYFSALCSLPAHGGWIQA